jgi:hypothetical protein
MRSSSPDAGKRIDAYFDAAPEFARAICRRLQRIILKADPAIVEDWKWGPHYSKDGMLCGIGAFTNHVSLAFFQGSSMKDPKHLFVKEGVPAKNMRRIKLVSIHDVHESILVAYVKEAVALNEGKIQKTGQTLDAPADLAHLFTRNKRLKVYFDSLAYTHRKEYIRWIEGAKKAETRRARVLKTIEMLKAKIKHP